MDNKYLASALMRGARSRTRRGEHERMGEDALQLSLAPDLAHDIARDPAEMKVRIVLSALLARLNCLAWA